MLNTEVGEDDRPSPWNEAATNRGIKLLELRQIIVSDERAFRAAVADFKCYDPDWTFAFHFDEKTDFAKYVQKVKDWSEGKDLGEFVPNTFLVAVVGSKIVGRVSLRHELNDFLLREGGHIGYGVNVPGFVPRLSSLLSRHQVWIQIY